MLLHAALLLAQTAPAPCPKIDATLPAALAGWTSERGDLESGRPILLRTMSSMVTFTSKIYEPGEALPGHVE